jgi:PST family polysaccharide transporter
MASFRKNLTILMVSQIATYIVPFVTLPWLTRVLQPSGYGRLAFAVAFTNYFLTFTNYSFSLIVTPKIAMHRDDRAERSLIFSRTITTQALITLTGFIVLLALTFLFPTLAAERALLLLGFCSSIGSLLTPGWYFQGREEMGIFNLIILSCRICTIPAVLVLVRTSQDVIVAMSINSTATLVIGVGCCVYLWWRDDIDFVRVTLADIFILLNDGWKIFISQAILDIYGSSNVVLLGFISGNVSAGYFAVAEKFLRASLGLIGPFKVAAYPRISCLMREDRDSAFRFLRKMLALQGSVITLLSVAIFLAAPLAVSLMYGPKFLPAVEILRWMAFVPLMVALSDLLGFQTMIPLGMSTQFVRMQLFSALINAVFLVTLAGLFGAPGAGAAMLIAETSVLIAMAVTLYWENVPVLRRSFRN